MAGDAIMVKMHGLKELDRKLGRLADQNRRGAKAVMRKAIRAGGKPFVKAARKAIQHNRTGHLKKSIGLAVRQYASGVSLVVVGPRRKYAGAANTGDKKIVPANYGHLVEKGTKPHTIRSKHGNLMTVRVGGKLVLTRAVEHPGARAKPFMLPAAKAAQAKSVRDFADKLGAEIVKQAKKK